MSQKYHLPESQSFYLKLIEKAVNYVLKAKCKMVEAMELITEIARLAVPEGNRIAPKDQIRLELCCFKLNRLLPKARLLEPIHELVFDDNYSIQDVLISLRCNSFPRKISIGGPNLDEFDEHSKQLFFDTLINNCSSRCPKIEINSYEYCKRNLLVMEKYYRQPFDCLFEFIENEEEIELLSLLNDVSIKTLTLSSEISSPWAMVNLRPFVDGCVTSKCLVSTHLCRLHSSYCLRKSFTTAAILETSFLSSVVSRRKTRKSQSKPSFTLPALTSREFSII